MNQHNLIEKFLQMNLDGGDCGCIAGHQLSLGHLHHLNPLMSSPAQPVNPLLKTNFLSEKYNLSFNIICQLYPLEPSSLTGAVGCQFDAILPLLTTRGSSSSDRALIFSIQPLITSLPPITPYTHLLRPLLFLPSK